jgi:6-phosphogluconolactonase
MSRYAYVSCAGDRTIRIFALETDGSLRPLSVVTVPGPDGPSTSSPLALSPDRRVMYVALRGAPFPLVSFALDHTDGNLTLFAEATLPDSMAYITTEPTGRWLLSASYPGSLVAVHAIDADGGVRGGAVQVIATPPKAHCIKPAPSGNFLYATSLGGDAILRWHLGPRGLDESSLRTTRLRTGAGPRHLTFANDRTLYCLNELDATLDVLTEDVNSGALAVRQTLPLLEGEGKRAAADLHLTGDGRLLFASERTSNALYGFRTSPDDAALAPLGATPCEATPRGFAIDPDGRFLLCAGQTANAVGLYAIDPSNGGLTRLGRYPTGPNPNWIEIVEF